MLLQCGRSIELAGAGNRKFSRASQALQRSVRHGIISTGTLGGRTCDPEAISLRHVIGARYPSWGTAPVTRDEVTVDLGPRDPVVIGNAIQLEQVFINLLTNARDALADVNRKAIRISGSAADAMVEIALTDTGRGIPIGLERRIFDPFFTTKEVGKGTGLGLSITYGIIQEHGGTIAVVSPSGEGPRSHPVTARPDGITAPADPSPERAHRR